MRHQGFPQTNTIRPTGKQKPDKTPESPATNQVKKSYNSRKKRYLTSAINVVTPFMHRDSNALQRRTNAKYATNTDIFQVYATKRKLRHITRAVPETPKHTGFMQAQSMCKTVPIKVIQKIPVLMSHFAYSCRSKAIMLKVSRFQTLSI